MCSDVITIRRCGTACIRDMRMSAIIVNLRIAIVLSPYLYVFEVGVAVVVFVVSAIVVVVMEVIIRSQLSMLRSMSRSRRMWVCVVFV